MLISRQTRDEEHRRFKRERSSSETIAGDDDQDQRGELEVEEVGSVDCRAAKRARNRELLAGGCEIIELDD